MKKGSSVGIPCPICNAVSIIIDTNSQDDFIRRVRLCKNKHKFITNEYVILKPIKFQKKK